jgi:hypothetical protein
MKYIWNRFAPSLRASNCSLDQNFKLSYKLIYSFLEQVHQWVNRSYPTGFVLFFSLTVSQYARKILMIIFNASTCSMLNLLPLRHTRTHLLKRLKNSEWLNLLLFFDVAIWLSNNLKISICFGLLMLFTSYLRASISMSIRSQRYERVVGWYIGNWLFRWNSFRFIWFFLNWHITLCIMQNDSCEQQRLLKSFKKSDTLLESVLFIWIPFCFAFAQRVKASNRPARTPLHSLNPPFSNNISRIRSYWRKVILVFLISFFSSPKQL